MNKKILSGVIILITIISVFIMLFYNNDISKENKKEDEGKIEVRKELNSQKLNNLNTQNNEDVKKPLEDKSIVKNKQEQKEGKDTKDNKKEVPTNEPNKNDNSVNVRDESALVFKVSKDNIPKQLTFIEKTKLLSILRKLSSIDYAKINESLSKSNELEAAKEALNLLKLRLNSRDYKEIKDILSRFIDNIDILENNI
ncbi:hypothetical protein [Desnuesiella massiliensis]|uniref:hypothetical protein n=1 Tax=Desnuesiella massiliensis TaxID=1650662 RepID=UPI0006E24DAB|nr:hypothetical protein [Desnuesiella massiliensis]